ncbi:hypothetical protein N4R57_05670 [Rhodobacteraceae bacterium D3-12]|nr:hypothetical protein N4R57_05670 [Rhodobacteraceae bacterium D3-12]
MARAGYGKGMVLPLILFLASLLVAGFAFVTQGGVLSDEVLLALLSGAAALVLAWREWRRVSRGYIVIDGSDVMGWGDAPRLATVRRVVKALEVQGFVPVVWFDADVGQSDAGLARALGVARRQVMVVPEGRADAALLAGAEALGARVVSNARYGDYTGRFEWLGTEGFLVPGQVDGRGVELRFA